MQLKECTKPHLLFKSLAELMADPVHNKMGGPVEQRIRQEAAMQNMAPRRKSLQVVVEDADAERRLREFAAHERRGELYSRKGKQ
jgi:hypothetical protein